MDNVTINTIQYPVYADKAFGDQYWGGMLGPVADKWANVATTDDMKSKALSAATTLIDNEQWDAILAGTQALRYAIADADGRAVFRLACADLAGQLLLTPALIDKSTSGSNVQRIDAGDGTAVRFFAPTLGETGRFPVRVQKYIGAYLDSAALNGISGSYSTGTKTYGPDATPNVPFDVDGNGYGTTRGQ